MSWKHYYLHAKAQSCQIFSVAYGQNLNKKWPKLLFFENVVAKITKCFTYGNLYNDRGLKMFGRPYLFCQKIWFSNRCKFWPQNSNFCHELKISCALVNPIVDKCFKSDPFLLNSLKLTFQSNDNVRILLILWLKYTNKTWNPWTLFDHKRMLTTIQSTYMNERVGILESKYWVMWQVWLQG